MFMKGATLSSSIFAQGHVLDKDNLYLVTRSKAICSLATCTSLHRLDQAMVFDGSKEVCRFKTLLTSCFALQKKECERIATDPQ